MARVRLETEISKEDFMIIRDIAEMFPEIRASMLGYVGSRGKDLLYNTFLTGQELLYKDRFDRKGRRTVSYSVAKRAIAVKIRSYPANFFENGRTLRSGRKEPAKRIITKKFKSVMNSALPGYINDFERMYIDRYFDKIGA